MKKTVTIVAVIGFIIECILLLGPMLGFIFTSDIPSYPTVRSIFSYSLPIIIAGILGIVPGIIMIVPNFISLILNFSTGYNPNSLQNSLITSLIAYVLPICLMGLVLPLIMEKVNNTTAKKIIPAIFCLLTIIIQRLGIITFWKIVASRELPFSDVFTVPQTWIAVAILLLYYIFFEYENTLKEKSKEAKMENTTENIETTGTESVVTENKQSVVSPKSRLALTLLALFLGQISIHRFYAGKIGTAILQLLLGGIGWILSFIGGGLGMILIVPLEIWILIDFIMAVCGVFKDGKGSRISKW